MNELNEKKEYLEDILRGMGRVAIAYSAGVDSTFLLKTAHDLLGDDAIAVTARSLSFPESELREAEDFCSRHGIRHIVAGVDQMSIPGFSGNPPDRCYICKRALFSELLRRVGELGFTNVADGSNADDDGEYRPGKRALAELGIRSPLKEAGFTKSDIRQLSHAMGLPVWSKPSAACLATRFPYGETITPEKLSMVDRAERFLREKGFGQVRVRVHGDVARIEIDPSMFGALASPDTAPAVNRALREMGFSYVSMDLGGYYTGSMDRDLL